MALPALAGCEKLAFGIAQGDLLLEGDQGAGFQTSTFSPDRLNTRPTHLAQAPTLPLNLAGADYS